MRNRIVLFLLFQVVAWTLYFNWDGPVETRVMSDLAQKTLRIDEVTSSTLTSMSVDRLSYDLILRADGFYTKINNDLSVQNGLWSVNPDLPTLLLSSSGEKRVYRIIHQSDASLRLELMDEVNVQQTENRPSESPRLFSSVN